MPHSASNAYLGAPAFGVSSGLLRGLNELNIRLSCGDLGGIWGVSKGLREF